VHYPIIVSSAMFVNSTRFTSYDEMINAFPFILSYEYLFGNSGGSDLPNYYAPPGPYVEYVSGSNGVNNNSRPASHGHKRPVSRSARR
jgi:hypothetical protein